MRANNDSHLANAGTSTVAAAVVVVVVVVMGIVVMVVGIVVVVVVVVGDEGIARETDARRTRLKIITTVPHSNNDRRPK